MRKLATPLLLLALAVPVRGQAPPGPVTPPYVKLPAALAVKAGRYFCLNPDTNCRSVKWIIPAGLDRLDPDIPVKNPNSVVLIGDAGTYTVSCYGALGDQATDIASCVVTVGTPPPPTPPTPPAPTDPFTLAAQAAYGQETSATKAADVATLASLYSQAAAGLAAVQPPITTNQDLKNYILTAAAAVKLTNPLPRLHAVVANELNAAWGNSPTQVVDLAAAKAELTKIATALGGLKGGK